MATLKHWLIGFGVGYSLFRLGAVLLSVLIVLGEIFWLWTAIQIGSFWMFILGLIPPLMVITGPVGAWSLLFGVPDWVRHLFG